MAIAKKNMRFVRFWVCSQNIIKQTSAPRDAGARIAWVALLGSKTRSAFFTPILASAFFARFYAFFFNAFFYLAQIRGLRQKQVVRCGPPQPGCGGGWGVSRLRPCEKKM